MRIGLSLQNCKNAESAKDYDKGIRNVKAACEADQYHDGDVPLSAQSGVVFDAIVEKDNSQKIETEASASPKPTPILTPTPSGSQPASQVDDKDKVNEPHSLKPTLISENTSSGTILIEFDVSFLSAGTKSIRLANGTQIKIEDSNGIIQLEIFKEDLNKQGELIFEALDDEGILLSLLSISITDHDQLIAVGVQASNSDFPVLWVIAGFTGLAAVVLVNCLVWKKRKRD